MIAALIFRNKLTCRPCGIISTFQRYYANEIYNKYSDTQKERILQVINEETSSLSSYEITKGRLKSVRERICKNGHIKTLSDIESIEGFTHKHAMKLYNSILDGPKQETDNVSKKIRGQILQPALSESVRKSCKSVLAVYVAVNSVCWALIDKDNYEVTEWRYHSIEYPNGKKMQMTDILNIAWDVTKNLPTMDICVMKSEATTLRATGSDPNNPKMLGVNLQKAQLIAMIVALVNAKSNYQEFDGVHTEKEQEGFSQKVYFLRSTLPYRLYGTLVGNEHVSTEQTIENIFEEVKNRKSNTQVYIPDNLIEMFRNNKCLQKDMLGQCLLLALTFMDICVYVNKDSISKLLKRGD